MLLRLICMLGGTTAVAEEAGVEATEADASATSDSVTLRGCTYTLDSEPRAGQLPPIYDVYVSRAASRSCHLPEARSAIGSSYAVPTLSIAGKGNRLAASFTTRLSPSGSAHSHVGIVRLSPATLSVLRSSMLSAASPGPHAPQLGNVFSGDLAIRGNALLVTGTKNGILGTADGGDNYVAIYFKFFTSIAPNPAPDTIFNF
jgi:hypothetical protein